VCAAAQSSAAKTAQIVAPSSAVPCALTLMRIQSAFENAGIRFRDNDAGGGIGIRLGASWVFALFAQGEQPR
jgi:hypothetical protein